MARTASTMIPLGTKAPAFVLPDVVTGNPVRVGDSEGEAGLLVMFICNHCPFVKHVQSELVKLANDFNHRGLRVIAISSNDAAAYPADGPSEMKREAETWAYPFPYLYDESQQVAQAYKAVCTPDFFLFDRDLLCVYRGQLDDSRPGNGIPVTGHDLRTAIEALLSQKQISNEQKASVGCNIKWRS